MTAIKYCDDVRIKFDKFHGAAYGKIVDRRAVLIYPDKPEKTVYEYLVMLNATGYKRWFATDEFEVIK